VEPTLELSVWLGVAGSAVVWANLVLWRTRHTLKKLRQDLAVPDGRLMPANVTELVSSVSAA
jgi:hypothetical protein